MTGKMPKLQGSLTCSYLIVSFLECVCVGGCSFRNSGNNKSPRASPGIPDCTYSDQEGRVLRKLQTTTSVCLSAFLARRLSIKQCLGCKPQLPADLVSEQIWQEPHSKALLTTRINHPTGNNRLFSNSYKKLLDSLYTVWYLKY